MTDTDTVTIAYIHPNEVAHSWHACLIDLIGHDIAHHQRIVRGGWLAMRCGTGGIVEARNQTVERFLTERDSDWLWWIDTDMGFAADTVDRLRYHAHPDERPIVGALCFSQRELSLDGMGGYRCVPCPTLFRWAQVGDGQEGFTAWIDYPRDQMVQVAGTGSACLLIHRSVLEKVQAEHGPNWYTPMINPTTGQKLSEDLSFCAKAVACGFPIHVHTGVKTTHLKALWLSEADYDRHLTAERPASSPNLPKPGQPTICLLDHEHTLHCPPVPDESPVGPVLPG